MYRYYFKLINNDGSINSIHSMIENNSSKVYSTVKNKFNGMKIKLLNRISLNEYIRKNW